MCGSDLHPLRSGPSYGLPHLLTSQPKDPRGQGSCLSKDDPLEEPGVGSGAGPAVLFTKPATCSWAFDLERGRLQGFQGQPMRPAPGPGAALAAAGSPLRRGWSCTVSEGSPRIVWRMPFFTISFLWSHLNECFPNFLYFETIGRYERDLDTSLRPPPPVVEMVWAAPQHSRVPLHRGHQPL